MFAPIKHSFKLVRKKRIEDSAVSVSNLSDVSGVGAQSASQTSNNTADDVSKRTFLKVLGGAGLGVAALSLIPDKAQALVVGSSPTTGVVGVKNAANNRVNPATEDGNLANIATNTSDLSAKDFATEATLGNIKTNTDKFAFDNDNNLKVVSTGGGSASSVSVKDTSGTVVNPSTDDSLTYLRRIVKLLESSATVDPYNRQRVAISEVYGTGTSVASQTPRVTVASDSSIVIAAGSNAIGTVAVSTITSVAGMDREQYINIAKNAYANGIRQNLVWS